MILSELSSCGERRGGIDFLMIEDNCSDAAEVTVALLVTTPSLMSASAAQPIKSSL